MLEASGRGLLLWLRNIPLLSALVLTVWLPGNIALNYFEYSNPSDDIQASDFWIPSLIDSIFGPLSLGAVIYALDQRWQGNRVGYFEALRVGFKYWVPLLFTKFIAELLVGIGFLLFVIPGIILALKYSFLGMVVILEGRTGSIARSRSADLMRGRMWAVLALVSVVYIAFFTVFGVLYLPLDLVYEATAMTEFQYYCVAICIDCFTDVLELSVVGLLFGCYVHATGRRKQPAMLDDIEPDVSSKSRPDDGNPYRPPVF